MVRPKVILPEKGLSEEQLLKNIEEIRKDDIVWEEGRVWSLVYHASDEHTEMLKKISASFSFVFPVEAFHIGLFSS